MRMLGVLFLVMLCEELGMIALKHWSVGKGTINGYLLIGVLLYGAVGGLLGVCFRLGAQLGGVSIVWSAMTIIAGVVLGSVIYGEGMASRKMGAVLLALGAIYLEQSETHNHSHSHHIVVQPQEMV